MLLLTFASPIDVCIEKLGFRFLSKRVICLRDRTVIKKLEDGVGTEKMSGVQIELTGLKVYFY